MFTDVLDRRGSKVTGSCAVMFLLAEVRKVQVHVQCCDLAEP